MSEAVVQVSSETPLEDTTNVKAEGGEHLDFQNSVDKQSCISAGAPEDEHVDPGLGRISPIRRSEDTAMDEPSSHVPALEESSSDSTTGSVPESQEKSEKDAEGEDLSVRKPLQDDGAAEVQMRNLENSPQRSTNSDCSASVDDSQRGSNVTRIIAALEQSNKDRKSPTQGSLSGEEVEQNQVEVSGEVFAKDKNLSESRGTIDGGLFVSDDRNLQAKIDSQLRCSSFPNSAVSTFSDPSEATECVSNVSLNNRKSRGPSRIDVDDDDRPPMSRSRRSRSRSRSKGRRRSKGRGSRSPSHSKERKRLVHYAEEYYDDGEEEESFDSEYSTDNESDRGLVRAFFDFLTADDSHVLGDEGEDSSFFSAEESYCKTSKSGRTGSEEHSRAKSESPSVERREETEETTVVTEEGTTTGEPNAQQDPKTEEKVEKEARLPDLVAGFWRSCGIDAYFSGSTSEGAEEIKEKESATESKENADSGSKVIENLDFDATFFHALWSEIKASKEQGTLLEMCGSVQNVEKEVVVEARKGNATDVKAQKKADLVLQQCKQRYPALYQRLIDRLDSRARRKAQGKPKPTLSGSSATEMVSTVGSEDNKSIYSAVIDDRPSTSPELANHTPRVANGFRMLADAASSVLSAGGEDRDLLAVAKALAPTGRGEPAAKGMKESISAGVSDFNPSVEDIKATPPPAIMKKRSLKITVSRREESEPKTSDTSPTLESMDPSEVKARGLKLASASCQSEPNVSQEGIEISTILSDLAKGNATPTYYSFHDISELKREHSHAGSSSVEVTSLSSPSGECLSKEVSDALNVSDVLPSSFCKEHSDLTDVFPISVTEDEERTCTIVDEDTEMNNSAENAPAPKKTVRNLLTPKERKKSSSKWLKNTLHKLSKKRSKSGKNSSFEVKEDESAESSQVVDVLSTSLLPPSVDMAEESVECRSRESRSRAPADIPNDLASSSLESVNFSKFPELPPKEESKKPVEPAGSPIFEGLESSLMPLGSPKEEVAELDSKELTVWDDFPSPSVDAFGIRDLKVVTPKIRKNDDITTDVETMGSRNENKQPNRIASDWEGLIAPPDANMSLPSWTESEIVGGKQEEPSKTRKLPCLAPPKKDTKKVSKFFKNVGESREVNSVTEATDAHGTNMKNAETVNLPRSGSINISDHQQHTEPSGSNQFQRGCGALGAMGLSRCDAQLDGVQWGTLSGQIEKLRGKPPTPSKRTAPVVSPTSVMPERTSSGLYPSSSIDFDQFDRDA